MNPNHYPGRRHLVSLPATGRAGGRDAAVGKTLVSSSMIDRVAAALGRRLSEVPVGFKWFVDGLLDGSLRLWRRGERRARPSCARDGTVWTTDKDGIIMDLLAAEITAATGRDPGEHYPALAARFGSPVYERIDAPGQPGAEGGAQATCSPEHGQRRRHWPASPSRQADPRPGQRRGHRRAEGRRPRTAGSPRGPRAPRTSTRSTPRASAARSTWPHPGRGAGHRQRRAAGRRRRMTHA